MVVRALTVLAGVLLCALAIVLFLLPELALPLLVAGLGLLALEFDWAARALAWVLVRSAQAKAWFDRQGALARIAMLVAAFVLLVGSFLLFL